MSIATIITVDRTINIESKHPPPVAILPALARLPCLVVGMPVAFAIFLFADVTPSALFALNVTPGIFFAITILLSCC